MAIPNLMRTPSPVRESGGVLSEFEPIHVPHLDSNTRGCTVEPSCQSWRI